MTVFGSSYERLEARPLVSPRRQVRTNHFRLLQSGEIKPRTATGTVTALLLPWSRRERIEERRLLIEAGVLKL